MHRSIAATALLVFAWVSLPAPAAAKSLEHEFISAALQGNLEPVRARMDAAHEAEPSSIERTLAANFRKRFVAGDETFDAAESPFVEGLLAVYREYWRKSLMQELPVEEGEAYLGVRLNTLLATHGLVDEPLGTDEALDHLLARLEAMELHAIVGVTRPYFDLMIWTTQEEKNYGTRLTDGRRRVKVVFADGFLVKGWSHYATFGRAHTGGWATPEALYCLREDYDLESEEFAISYLKHESRHLADYELFPALEQSDLEYRAKLTELAFARETLVGLLESFGNNAAPNEEAPHAYANDVLIRQLAERLFESDADITALPWAGLKPRAVHREARRLLREHTRRLVQADAATATRVIGPG